MVRIGPGEEVMGALGIGVASPRRKGWFLSEQRKDKRGRRREN